MVDSALVFPTIDVKVLLVGLKLGIDEVVHLNLGVLHLVVWILWYFLCHSQSIYQMLNKKEMVNTFTMNELIYINELNVNTIYFIVQNFNIQVEGLGDSSNFTGKTIYCKCVNAGRYVAAEWALTSGYQYATINQNGRIDINTGVQDK